VLSSVTNRKNWQANGVMANYRTVNHYKAWRVVWMIIEHLCYFLICNVRLNFKKVWDITRSSS